MDKARNWSSRSIPLAERRAFLEDVVAPGNLQRLLWFIVLYLPVSLSIFVLNVVVLHDAGLMPWLVFDLTLAVGFLVLVVWLRGPGAEVRWKRHVVMLYYLYILVSMNGYYFSVYAMYGENPSYILGVLMAGVIFVLPPGHFLPILLGNHVVYLWLLTQMGRTWEGSLISIFGGTNAVILGCLASWFLFRRKWENHENSEMLARSNRQLAAANARLVRTNEEVGELMAITAHDLRSPLAAVRGLYEVLHEEPEWRREPYAGVLAEVGEMSQGMLDLVARLLEAHAAENLVKSVALRPVDISGVVALSGERFRRAAGQKEIALNVEPDGPVVVRADPDAVAQVLDNLLSNAVKYSPRGSRIDVGLARWDGSCAVEVRDEGPGVPEEERERIFEKFHRGRNQPTDGEASTGLGLFIVRKVAESLGGTVECLPRTPRGAVFRLVLPAGE